MLISQSNKDRNTGYTPKKLSVNYSNVKLKTTFRGKYNFQGELFDTVAAFR